MGRTDMIVFFLMKVEQLNFDVLNFVENDNEPPEAPGFLGFLRPQNASPLIVFLSFLRQVFL